jgi:hypothetical protein
LFALCESEKYLRYVVAAAAKFNDSLAGTTGLPSSGLRQFSSLAEVQVVGTVGSRVVCSSAEGAGIRSASRARRTVDTWLYVLCNDEHVAGYVAAKDSILSGMFHSGELKSRKLIRVHVLGNER